LEPVGDFVQLNGLLFQGLPQSFDKDVVEISAPTIYYRQVIGAITERHRCFDVGFSQSRDPASACVLAALIRIHDFRLAVFGDASSSASSATVALNLSEKSRRFVIRVSIHSCGIHLSTPPKFARPLL